jgi:nicotinamidase-related amidase
LIAAQPAQERNSNARLQQRANTLLQAGTMSALPCGMKDDLGDLHGSAPDSCEAALLLIDVVNDLDFPEAPQLLRHALPMAKNLARLKQRLKKAGIPVVYVNDNFGRWRSNLQGQLEHTLDERSRGKPIVELLTPAHDDYFVLKPKHSGFFSTTLDTLLRYLGTRRVVITGVATNICVLFTANDAYMRDLEIFVPSDCCAANTKKEHDFSLAQMETVLKADVRPSTSLRTTTLLKRDKRSR